MTRGSFLLVVSGLRAEARIAARTGVRALAGGGNAARLAAAINRGICEGANGLLSFGMAGGLEPGLAPGTIVVPGVVIAGTERSMGAVSFQRSRYGRAFGTPYHSPPATAASAAMTGSARRIGTPIRLTFAAAAVRLFTNA